MPGPVFLEGDVVELRTTEPEDVEFLQQLINDPRVRLNIGSTDPINGPEERELVESIGDRDGFHWTICADGDPVGTVGLHRPNEVWGTTEIGYSVAPEHWDNGYATDAIDLACRYAFQERRLHKVYASVYATIRRRVASWRRSDSRRKASFARRRSSTASASTCTDTGFWPRSGGGRSDQSSPSL